MTDPTGLHDFKTIRNAKSAKDGLIECPVIPLGDVVIFPDIISPLLIPPASLAVVKSALENHRTVVGVAQRDPLNSDVTPEGLYTIGTEIALSELLSLPTNAGNMLAQGRRRVEIATYVQTEPHLIARARPLPEPTEQTPQTPGMMQAVLDLFKQIAEMNEQISDEVYDFVLHIEQPGILADAIAASVTFPFKERQRLLEMLNLDERFQHLALLLGRELNLLEMREEIDSQVQQEMARGQRENYLREQMRIIQTELGEEDIFQQELNELREQIFAAQLPQEVHDKALKELARLELMPPMAPEVGMIHTYLDWLVDLPWVKHSPDNLDITHAKQVLDNAHYGLAKVKDRILEHIAVRKLAAEKMKSPILCFLGPPGVGKTSMGKSIAQALGREFVRVSLGGVRDESEIRGHRRTYIGALPGRIIQTMRRAGTINPVFMLDEIDKLGVDFRGDPAAALLEALDPEQNNAYLDHYLDVPYDLSKVMFITTANDLSPLPMALEDRMEVIEFTGYVDEEKQEIARQFIIPKQLEAHGLADAGLHFETGAIAAIIREYTYESGVRNLEREIANICRKSARLVAENKSYPHRITAKQVSKYLGPPGYIAPRPNDEDSVGIVTGLVYTSGGGDIQTIEVSIMAGKGNLILTGQLGDILQESAQTALGYMRARAAQFDVPDEDFENYDIHIHMPEGSVPKEGSSAGITLAAGIVSAFTERKIRSDYAMTGEITLRGKVLPVGGIKEKVLAARRARLSKIILPTLNQKDLVDIPPKALRDLNIRFVEDMQQVIDIVLLEPPPDGRQRDKYRADDEPETSDGSPTTGDTKPSGTNSNRKKKTAV